MASSQMQFDPRLPTADNLKGRTTPIILTPPPSTKKQDFAFVNISKPADSVNTSNLKFVRRHVRSLRELPQNINAKPIVINKPERQRHLNAVELDKGDLTFVTVSHPRQIHLQETRLFVRRNAQPKVKQTSRKKEWKKDDRDGKGEQGGLKGSALDTTKHQILDEYSRSFLDLFSDRVDISKTIIPVKMNPETTRIVEYMHMSPKVTLMPPIFVPLYYHIIMSHPAAFHAVMCLVITQQRLVHGVDYENSYLHHHSTALRIVHRRLSSKVDQTCIKMVSSILFFMYLDVLNVQPERFVMNLLGFRRIIHMRGGIQTLDSDWIHRILLLALETCAAYGLAIAPTYYLEGRASTIQFDSPMYEPSRRWLNILGNLSEILPSFTIMNRILQDMHAYTTFVDVHGTDRIIQEQVTRTDKSSVDCIALPLFKTFLDDQVPDFVPGRIVEKVICLSSLCYLNRFRDAVGNDFLPINRKWISSLIELLADETSDWMGLEDLRRWCIAQGWIHAGAEQSVFVDLMRREMAVDMMIWVDVVASLKDMFYLDSLFAAKYAEFGSQCNDWEDWIFDEKGNS